jgi:hypothetical protein
MDKERAHASAAELPAERTNGTNDNQHNGNGKWNGYVQQQSSTALQQCCFLIE